MVGRDEILRELAAMERLEGIDILYAAESGSRAWGFASPDSDYDIRFVYKHPTDWYLSVNMENKKDTIERHSRDLDLSGWDVRKALKLYRKTNMSIYEWLRSPIIYANSGALASTLQEYLQEYFNPKAAYYHYLNLARSQYNRYISGKKYVPPKKYLYVIRPILCVRWIYDLNGIPPVRIDDLIKYTLPAHVNDEYEELLHYKKANEENALIKRMKNLDDFIERQIALHLLDGKAPITRAVLPIAEFDELFRDVLREKY